jgi:hypothetical protein
MVQIFSQKLQLLYRQSLTFLQPQSIQYLLNQSFQAPGRLWRTPLDNMQKRFRLRVSRRDSAESESDDEMDFDGHREVRKTVLAMPALCTCVELKRGPVEWLAEDPFGVQQGELC